MDIKRLHYFLTIVEKGSFSKAAEALNISQPPLSQRIKELEGQVGAKLINREKRQLKLTKEGEYIYEKAREIMVILDSIPRGIAQIKNKIGDTFYIGVSPTCLSYLTSCLPLIQREFPETYISIATGDSSYLEKVLNDQKIDAALIQLPRELKSEYDVTLLHPTEIMAVLPKNFQSKKTLITFNELAKIPLALLKRISGIGIYDLLMDVFNQFDLQPTIVMDSPEVQTILSFMQTKGNVGSVLPKSELSPEVYANYRVMSVDYKDFFMYPCLIHLKEKSAIPVLKKLKDVIQGSLGSKNPYEQSLINY